MDLEGINWEMAFYSPIISHSKSIPSMVQQRIVYTKPAYCDITSIAYPSMDIMVIVCIVPLYYKNCLHFSIYVIWIAHGNVYKCTLFQEFMKSNQIVSSY